MKKRGSITIYLSIILVSVILIVSVISESGRVNAIQTQSKGHTYMASESVLAGYAKQIYKDYGVLLVWEDEPTEEKLKKYIQDNINMADLKGENTNFTKSNLVNININKEYVIDDGGKKFTEQIISYMKYAGTINAANNLVQKVKEYSKINKTEMSDKSDVTYIVDDNSNELKTEVEKINEIVTKLKDTKKLKDKLSEASQKLEKLKSDNLSTAHAKKDKKETKKFLSKYRKLMTELDRKASDVRSAITLTKQYDRKKELFLKEHGYTTDAGDYIDENLKTLENVEDKIKKNKELNVLKFSDIDSKNIEIVSRSIKEIEAVENKLQSLQVNRTTEKDKENQSVYERAESLLKKGILSLVIDDVTAISDSAVSLSNLPTTMNKEKISSSILETSKNKAVISMYAKMKFGNYLGAKDETALSYEMEYIIGGQNSDRDNLIKVIEKIIAVRNVLNIASIAADKEKMSQISAVSSSVTTVIGLPFLEPVIKGVLMEAWALAEAASDVKELLKGEKIPLLKKSKNWNTSLKNLSGADSKRYEGKNGLSYEDYLLILMMLSDNHNCVYRIMDLIQINTQKRYNKDFLMARCLQGFSITASFEAQPLFTAMPWVISMLSENNGAYKYDIKCSYSY